MAAPVLSALDVHNAAVIFANFSFEDLDHHPSVQVEIVIQASTHKEI